MKKRLFFLATGQKCQLLSLDCLDRASMAVIQYILVRNYNFLVKFLYDKVHMYSTLFFATDSLQANIYPLPLHPFLKVPIAINSHFQHAESHVFLYISACWTFPLVTIGMSNVFMKKMAITVLDLDTKTNLRKKKSKSKGLFLHSSQTC